MCGGHDLAAAISLLQSHQFRKESSIEDHGVATVVAVSRPDDFPGYKRLDELDNRVGGQQRLVGNADQGRRARAGQCPNADLNRGVDATLRLRIRLDGYGQTGESVHEAPVTGHHGDHRRQASLEETAGGPPHQRFTTPGLEQFLTTKPAGEAGGEEDPRNQLAAVAAFSSWSTQLANR